MTGRHRRGAARTEPAPTRAPGPVGITERRTHRERLVTDEAAAHRHAGRYLAVRGARVLDDGRIEFEFEFDPPVAGACVITLDEPAATELFDALGEWLG